MDAHNDDVTGGRGGRERGWSPGWAKAVAGVGLLLALVPLGYGLRLLFGGGQDSGETADAVGAAIGQVTTLYGLVILGLLGWFLARGGRVSFTLGAGLVALGAAYYLLL